MAPYTDVLVHTIDNDTTTNNTDIVFNEFRAKLRQVHRTTWQTYIEHLMACNSLEKAALFYFDNTRCQCIAETYNSNITTKEAMDLLKSMENININYQPRFENKRYMRLRIENNLCYGMAGPGGFYSHKTKLLLLIGIYGRDHQPGRACAAVEKLTDYFIEAGY